MKTIKFLGGFTLSFAILLFIITSCNTGRSTTSIIDNRPEVGFTKVHTTSVGTTSSNVIAPVGVVNVEVNASSSSLLNPIDKVTVSVVGGSQSGEDDSAPFIIPLNFSTEGDYELVAKAVDKNGLTSSEQTINVTIVANQTATGAVAASKPTVTWQTPNQGSTVSGNVILEVDVEDLNDLTISSDDGNITQLEFYAGSIFLGNATSPERNKWRLAWDSTTASQAGDSFIDGSWELVAIATDDQGETGVAYQRVILNNTPNSPELNAEVKLRNIRPGPQVVVGCSANANVDTTLNGCFSEEITVYVTVTDETGVAEVTLQYYNKTQNEGYVVGTAKTQPYQFEFDTAQYKNGDVITFTPVITSGDYSVQGATSEEITIYNADLQPELTILSPSEGDTEINGLLDVRVAIDNLSNSDYTLDLDGDNIVNHISNPAEGVLVEFLLQDGNGDNKLSVAEERISEANLEQTMHTQLDSKYQTPSGFDTSNYANREYIVKTTVKVKQLSTGQVFTLEDELNIRTKNSGPVPPSVLILSPVNDPNSGSRIIRDPSDAYISVQGTDDGGIVHMELEIFTGDLQYDETPSRFVSAFSTPVLYTKAALPINYNAHPYIPDSPVGSDYIVRVTTEDTDGNRTHQDTTIRLDRANQSLYYLEQTGPDIPKLFETSPGVFAIQGDGIADQTLNEDYSIATFEVKKYFLERNADGSLLEDAAGNYVIKRNNLGQAIDDSGNVLTIEQYNPLIAGLSPANLDGTERFDALVRVDGQSSFRPSTDTSSENPRAVVGLTEEDLTHYMRGQVITADGHVYTTNTLGVIRLAE